MQKKINFFDNIINNIFYNIFKDKIFFLLFFFITTVLYNNPTFCMLDQKTQNNNNSLNKEYPKFGVRRPILEKEDYFNKKKSTTSSNNAFENTLNLPKITENENLIAPILTAISNLNQKNLNNKKPSKKRKREEGLKEETLKEEILIEEKENKKIEIKDKKTKKRRKEKDNKEKISLNENKKIKLQPQAIVEIIAQVEQKAIEEIFQDQLLIGTNTNNLQESNAKQSNAEQSSEQGLFNISPVIDPEYPELIEELSPFAEEIKQFRAEFLYSLEEEKLLNNNNEKEKEEDKIPKLTVLDMLYDNYPEQI